MYGWFVAFLALTFFSSAFEKASPELSALVMLIPMVAFAAYADAFYYRHARAKIVSASHIGNSSDLLEHLRHTGGVHTWVVWIVVSLAVLAVIVAGVL